MGHLFNLSLREAYLRGLIQISRVGQKERKTIKVQTFYILSRLVCDLAEKEMKRRRKQKKHTRVLTEARGDT